MATSFIYNSINSKAKYIKAIKCERILIPEPKHEFVEISHRDGGGIMIFDDTYKDYMLPIECLLKIPNNKSIFEVGRELAEWFSVQSWGYLKFDDDPNYVMRAVMVSQVGIDDIKSHVITLNFRVRAKGDLSS